MNELKIKVEQDNSAEEMKKEREKWEIEDAVRILTRAEEIKQDAELMKLVEPKLKQQIKIAANLADILYKKEDKNDESKSN